MINGSTFDDTIAAKVPLITHPRARCRQGAGERTNEQGPDQNLRFECSTVIESTGRH